MSKPKVEITPEMIRRGIDDDIVRFIIDPNAESGTVCGIGNHWFYFGGLTAETYDPDDYLKVTDVDDNIASIIDALECLNHDEFMYYYYTLVEQLNNLWKDPAQTEPPLGTPLLLKYASDQNEKPAILGPVYLIREAGKDNPAYYSFNTNSKTYRVFEPEKDKLLGWRPWKETK